MSERAAVTQGARLGALRLLARALSAVARHASLLGWPHFLLALCACTLVLRFVSGTFELSRWLRDYSLNAEPVAANSLGKSSVRLTGVDFDKVTSLVVRLRGDEQAALSIVPDCGEPSFSSARLSSMASLRSGYLRFAQGIPVDFHPIQSVQGKDSAYDVPIPFPGSSRTPRSLCLVSYPPSSPLDWAVADLELRYANGEYRAIRLDPAPAVLLCLVLAFPLAAVLVGLDHRVLSRQPTDHHARTVGRRVTVLRLLGVLYLAPLAHVVLGHVYPQKASHFLLLVLVQLLLFWTCAGETLRLLAARRWEAKGKRPIPLPVLVLAVILLPWLPLGTAITAHKTLAGFRMTGKLVFNGTQFRRTEGNEPVVLCMGGSSTAGDPFESDWPFDYPRQLGAVLSHPGRRVIVANAGVTAATSYFALARLPILLDRVRPNVITLNYLFNDSAEGKISDKYRETYRATLRALVGLIRARGAEVVFVLEPDFHTVYLGEAKYVSCRQAITQVATETGSTLVDPTAAFEKERDRFLFMDDSVHLTRYGNDLLTQVLASELEKILGAKAGIPGAQPARDGH